MKKIILSLLAGLLFSVPAGAASLDETPLPASVEPALSHLIELAAPNSGSGFRAEAIEPLLEFVLAPKNSQALYYGKKRKRATSAYYEADIRRGLREVIELTYSPDIPSYITSPSSVRLSYWKQIEGGMRSIAKLWEKFETLGAPVMVRGVEYVENTPDLFSGGYYGYDLDRVMILFKHRGKRVLVSLSKQKGTSDVGRKGLVLGPDEEWNYLYTGEKGLTRSGLGWVDSYMYDSSSVVVYYETEPGAPSVRFSVFKWLRAGWSNLNMVRSHHIHEGLLRFGKTYKEILESPYLPETDTLRQAFAQIDSLSTKELRAKSHTYFKRLAARYGEGERSHRKWFDRLFKDDRYLGTLNNEEMKSILCLEYLKGILGRSNDFRVERIRPAHPAVGG